MTISYAQQIALLLLAFNGAFILLSSSIIGAVFGRRLASRKITAEKKEAWRMAHSSSSVFGVFLIATAAITPYLNLSAESFYGLMLSLIASGYGFLLGAILAALTGQRGLRLQDKGINHVVFALYMVGVLGSFIGIFFIILGCMRTLFSL